VHISSLLKKLLGVNDIVIGNVKLEKVNGEEILIISARPPKYKQHRCGLCGKKAKGYDSENKLRRWRALDLGTLRVYIEAPAPRVCCKNHGVVTAAVPWARHNARFTYNFEDSVAWLLLHASKTVVSEYMRIAWETVGGIAKRVYDDVKVIDAFDGLSSIGIDETSYKKGHKYMTVIVDHVSGRLIWAAPGYGKTVLEGFFEQLTPEQRMSIKHVTGDGAGWIKDCATTYCKNASFSIDPFHVVQWVTEALDEVRKVVWNEARKQEKAASKDAPKRKVGRPKKGEEKPKDSVAKAVKGSRYSLLKNPDTLTASQEATVEMIAKQNTELYRAYLLKEKLRLIFKLPVEEAERELDGWRSWAQRCRIPQFVELQRKIGRHKESILSTIRYGLSNARIESMNNKIKLTIRMAYGFRNIDNMLALIMLRCSKVDISLPGRV
jgi:transposase